MTVETHINVVQYQGNGATTVFPIPFPVYEGEWIHLYFGLGPDVQEVFTGFSVSGAGGDNVNLIMEEAPAAGTVLTVIRNVPLEQLLDLLNGGNFNAEVIESNFDRIVMMIQQVQEQVSRAPVAPPGSDPLDFSWMAAIRDQAQAAAGEAETSAEEAEASATRAAGCAGRAETAANSAMGSSDRAADSASEAQESAELAAQFAAAIEAGMIAKMTKAELDADLNHKDGTMARVIADPDPANNGDYVKFGDSGAGYWWPAGTDRLSSLENKVSDLENKAWRPDLFLDYYSGQILGDDRGRSYSLAATDSESFIGFGLTTDGQFITGDLVINQDGRSSLPFEIAGADGGIAAGIHLDGSTVIGNAIVQSKNDEEYAFQILDLEGRMAFAIGHDGNTHIFSAKIDEPSDMDSLDNQKTDYMHIFSYGQSLSRGSTGVPLRSTSQPYGNKTFLSGVLIRPLGGNSDIGATAVYDPSGFKPLVEERPGTHPSGETPTSSALNGLGDLIAAGGGDPLDYSFIGSAPGWGGQPIVNLMKNAPSTSFIWDGMMTQVRDAMALAAAEGKSYSVWGMLWAQGENDAGTEVKVYYDALIKLKNEFATEVSSITGQRFIPPLFTYQTGAHRRYSRNDMPVAVAQLKAARDDDDIVMVCPIYHLPHSSDNLHLTNDSYVQFGKYYSKAFYQTIFEKKPWKPLWPERIIWQGRIIDISFNVPDGLLTWDTVLVSAAPNYGFDVWRNSSEITNAVNSVSLSADGRRVKIKLNISPLPGDRLTYGRGRVDDPLTGGPLTGPRGNLRDQSGDADNYIDGAGIRRYMHNWCVMFETAYEG